MEIRNFLTRYEVLSMSGIDGSTESGDFILGNQNKILLAFLPPGIPTYDILDTSWRMYHVLQMVIFSIKLQLFIMNFSPIEKCSLLILNNK